MHGPRGNCADSWDWAALGRVALRESRRVLGDGQDAEDAAQEAMIRAFRSRVRCLSAQAPEGWVRAIARREAYRQFSAAQTHETALDHVPEERVDAPIGVVHDQLAAAEVLSRIPVADRSLLLRRYVLDQSSAQIAAELALPPATVRVRIHRAAKRLREFERLWG
jgi:RNA polymerase sigma-70 factor, ECF subfamily